MTDYLQTRSYADALANVNGLFNQRAQIVAGRQAAGGNLGAAAGTLLQNGDLQGGFGIQDRQAQQAATQRTQADQDSARQLQFTMQAIRSLKGSQDPLADFDRMAPTFQQFGVGPQEIQGLRQGLATNPNFLADAERIVGEQARKLQIVNLGEGNAAVFDEGTGDVVNTYRAPRDPKRVAVGNDYIEVGEDGQVTPLYQGARPAEYRTVRNTDGSESLVEVGGRPGGVLAPQGAGQGGASSPRGIRNNNPGNIEDGAFARSLPGYAGSDGRFAIFETPEAGAQAAPRLLQSYVQRGFDTPAKIINRWAPPSDGNPTNAYAQYVAQRVGIGINDTVTPDQIPLVAQAISEFENGQRGPSQGPSVPSSNGVRVVAQSQDRGPSPTEARQEARAQQEDVRAQSTLRREFNARPDVKEFREIDNAYRTMRGFVESPSAAGDISLIFSFMKVLDPTSTVREGEFATAQNSGGVPESVRNLANRAINGQRLQPNQRRDFLSQAQNIRSSREQRYNQVVNEYSQEASLQGFDPSRIIGSTDQPAANTPRTNAPGLRFNITPQQLERRQAIVAGGGSPRSGLGTRQNPRYINPSDPSTSYGNVRSGEFFVTPDGQIRGPKP